PLVAAAAAACALAFGLWVSWPTAHRPTPAVGLRTRLLVGTFENRTGLRELDGTVEALVGELASNSERVDTTAGAELGALAKRLGLEGADIDTLAQKAAA